MTNRLFRILEVNKIKDKLKDYSISMLAKEWIENLNCFTSISKVQDALNETEEAFQALIKLGKPPIFAIHPMQDNLIIVEKGGVLEPGQLLDVADNLRCVQAMKDYGQELETKGKMKECIDLLTGYGFLVRKIEQAILSPEEISDEASPELKRIRKDILRTEMSIREKLQGILHSSAYDGQLQDKIITMREGRYVVPVKAEFKNRFSGVVHDQSGSGATAYIEPMSVVKLNNDLRTLEGQEREEIFRILKKLSGEVKDNSDGIYNNENLMVTLDFGFAKARLALEMDATKPKISEGQGFNLKSARHPLLHVKKVVPISVYLGDDFTTLVITGPNTGGKTVTLKTVGLIQVMAQCGLFVPCEEGSKINVYQKIFVDIGDEQSIEQSLSTFSSHMTNIISIMKQAGRTTLVLLDELGAGTDPTEGAALAMAILEELRQRGVHTLATTHYSQLKTYALTTEKVRNASVEFDIRTLSPTYRLIIGAPGKSNAFEISKHLGLEEKYIERAKSYIGLEESKIENLFANLERDRILMEQNQLELSKNRKEIQALKDKLSREVEKNKNSREKIIEKAKEEAKDMIKETKVYANELIKELKALDRMSPKDRARGIQGIQESLRKRNEKYQEKESAFLNETVDEHIENLKLGEEVEIITMGQRGYVLSLPDNQNNVLVQVGILKINTDLATLRRVKSKHQSEGKTNAGGVFKAKSQMQVSREIDVRGKNVEEAIQEIEKYLDDVIIVGLKEIQIIHGKGTGMLRKGLQEYLRKHPHVKSVRDGKLDEGGVGVSIVTLS